MNLKIVLRGAHCTHWAGYTEAFMAWQEACAIYPEWAFRLRSGAEVGTYRIEAFKIASADGGWLRQEP